MENFKNTGYHGNSEDLPARKPYNGTEKIYKNTVDDMVDPDSQNPYRELFGIEKENLPQHGEHEDTSPNSRIWNGYVGAFVEQNNTVETSDTEEVIQDKIIDSMFETGHQDEETEREEQKETQLTESEIEKAGKLVSNKESILTKSKERRFFVHKTLTNENLKTISDSGKERMNRGELSEIKKHNEWDAEQEKWDNMEDGDFMPHYLLESAS